MVLRAVVLALVCLLGLLAPAGGGGSVQAATLDVRGGILFGASGVVVGGRTFDVEFIDGSCVGLFDGCEGPEDFDFASETAANAALQVLADQVFVDGPAGQFDSNILLTNGCAGNFTCNIFIPLGFDGNNPSLAVGRSFVNVAPGSILGDDFFGTTTVDKALDLTGFSTFTYAQFTPVPVPAALPMLLGGLGLLALVGRRRRG